MNIERKSLGLLRLLLVGFILGGAFVLFAHPFVRIHSRLLAFVTCCAGLLPLILWARARTAMLPVGEIIVCYAGVNFGFGGVLLPPAILIQSQVYDFPTYEYLASQAIALLGVVAIGFGFLLCQNTLSSFIWKREFLDLTPKAVRLLAISAIGLGAAADGARALGLWQIGGLGKFLSSAPLVAIAALSLVIASGRDTRRTTCALFWSLLIYRVVIGLATGMLEEALMPVAVWGIAWVGVRRKVSLALMLSLGVGFLVLNVAKFEVRERTWFGIGDSLGGRLGAWVAALGELSPEAVIGSNSGEVSVWRQSLGRVSLMQRFAWVRENTPGRVPYFGGTTYALYVYAIVPRVVWPQKPDMNLATQLLDYSYDLKDSRTGDSYSIGIGLLGEGYANFGIPGVGAVGLLFGALVGILSRVLNAGAGIGTSAVWLVTGIGFLNGMGTSSVVMLGAVFYLILLSIVWIWCVARIAGARAPTRRRAVPAQA